MYDMFSHDRNTHLENLINYERHDSGSVEGEFYTSQL